MDHESNKNVLIIGGGAAGMSAAKVLSAQGVNVHLVEKKDHLGGLAFDWACMATDKCEYCGACLSQELVEEVERLEHATVYQGCTVQSINKFENGYQVTINGGTESQFEVQAVILSSGFEPFNPRELEFFEYNRKGVVTTAKLNTILKNEDLANVLKTNDPPSIAFIQCVGSRNREIGLDYCSQVCCKTAVRHAKKIMHLIPEASVTIFHMDLQVCGKMFRTQVDQLGERVKLVQGVPGTLLSLDDNKIRLIQEESSTGKRKPFDFDMVVLAVGMKSGNDNSELAGLLGMNQDKWGFINDNQGSSDLKVYHAGSVQGPLDIITALEQGVSTAHKLLHDLDILEVSPEREIAVIGKGGEGEIISKALADAGRTVHLFDSENNVDEYDGRTVYHNTQITDISGTSGSFTISGESENKKTKIQVSAIVVASGSSKASLSDEDTIPESDNIISLSEFRKNSDNINENINDIVFWMDHAGPEQKQNARTVLDSVYEMATAGKSVSVIMERMLVNGLHGQEHYDRARKTSVKFLRVNSPSDVNIQSDTGKIKVSVNEATLAGITLKIPCDLLVIPDKISPNPDNPAMAEILKQKIDEEGYHQHPNPRHRRVMSTRRGIFYAGSCHDETDKDDLGHEIRTINAFLDIVPSKNPEEENYAEIDKGKCVRCLTCLRICPHKSVILDGYEPKIIGEACYACGLCVTSCPGGAISMKRQTVPGESENGTRDTVIFACKRSAVLAEKSNRLHDSHDDSGYRIIPVDCACSLDSNEVMNQFIEGAERIMVLACHSENCLSMQGDTSARLKIDKIHTDTGISKSKLSLHSVAANEPIKLKQLIEGVTHDRKENSND